MDCCNYVEYRATPHRATPSPAHYCDPYARHHSQPYYRAGVTYPHAHHYAHSAMPACHYNGGQDYIQQQHHHQQQQQQQQQQHQQQQQMQMQMHMQMQAQAQMQVHSHMAPLRRLHPHAEYGYGSEEARTCAGNTDRRHHHPLANQGNWMATGAPMPFLDADVPPWNYYQNRCRSPRGSYQLAGPTLAQQSGYSAAHHLQAAERPLRNLAEAQPVAVPQEKILNGRSEPKIPSQPVVTSTEKRSETTTPIAAKAVPLPAFQQAFGSTEIGRFSEAFIRSEEALSEGAITEEMVSRAIRSQLPGDEWREAYFQIEARGDDAD